MTAHELARELLEGPDVLVVKQGHEPNDDMFDIISMTESIEAIQYDFGSGFTEDLNEERSYMTKGLPTRRVPVVVIR